MCDKKTKTSDVKSDPFKFLHGLHMARFYRWGLSYSSQDLHGTDSVTANNLQHITVC